MQLEPGTRVGPALDDESGRAARQPFDSPHPRLGSGASRGVEFAQKISADRGGRVPGGLIRCLLVVLLAHWLFLVGRSGGYGMPVSSPVCFQTLPRGPADGGGRAGSTLPRWFRPSGSHPQCASARYRQPPVGGRLSGKPTSYGVLPNTPSPDSSRPSVHSRPLPAVDSCTLPTSCTQWPKAMTMVPISRGWLDAPAIRPPTPPLATPIPCRRWCHLTSGKSPRVRGGTAALVDRDVLSRCGNRPWCLLRR